MTKAQADRFVLDGVTYTVDPQNKLGAGAEGMVIVHPRDPQQCVKLFHPVDSGDKNGRLLATYRGRKILTICNAHLALPTQFVLPLTPVFTSRAPAVPAGYVMRRVPAGYHKLKQLTSSAFRSNQAFGLSKIVALFADLFDDLAIIHHHKIVVGDLNLGCVLFQPGGGRAWVDTDSWGFPGTPGLAITELFAHPDLYVNLDSTTSQTVTPQPHHDRFALTVMLTMMAIPGAHPFRMGSHPSVFGLQNRAKAGITIFDSDVTKPATVLPEVLSDDLLQAIIDRLKRKTNQPLDPAMLHACAGEVATCGACGTEYHASRARCPKCQQVTVMQLGRLVSYLFEQLWVASGTLLFAQMVGTDLYLVHRLARQVRVLRLDQHGTLAELTPKLPDIHGARYRFFADCLAVCEQPSAPGNVAAITLYRIRGNRLVPMPPNSTGVLKGEGAVFDASGRYLYRIAGNALLKTELFAPTGGLVDTQVATVYQQQSWFAADHNTNADREVLFGYDRAFRMWEWFVILGSAKGSHYQYHKVGDLGLRTDESIQDFAVYFSANSVLLVLQTSHLGRESVRYAVIGFDGLVHLNQTVEVSDAAYQYWSNIRGKLHQGGSVLHVTPDGIVKQSFTDNSYTLLRDTEGRVGIDHRLMRLGGSRLGIVDRRGVTAMTKK